MISNHHILGFSGILGLVFGHVCSIGGCLHFGSHDHVNFGKSRDQNTKTLKTRLTFFLC